jgi:hypothetical protein
MRYTKGQNRPQFQIGPNPIANSQVGKTCTIRTCNVDKDRVTFKNHPARIVGKFDDVATISCGSHTVTFSWREVEQVMLTTGIFST